MLELLERISAHWPLSKDLERFFAQALPLLQEALGAKGAAVWLLEEDGKRLRLEAHSNLPPAFSEFFLKEEHRPRVGEGVVGKVFANRDTVVEHNILQRSDVPEHWKKLILSGALSFRTLAAHPLLSEGKRLVGVLNLYFGERRELSKEELRAIRIVASLLGGKIENQDVYDKLKRSRQELEVSRSQLAGLQRTTQLLSITGEKSLRELLDELSQSIGGALNTSALAIWRPTKGGKHLFIYTHKGLAERYVESFNRNPLPINRGNIVGRAASTKKPVFLSDVHTYDFPGIESGLSETLIDLAIKEKVLSIASLPLMVRGELFGILNFYFAESHAYSPGERHIFESVGNMVAIAVGNILYRDELKDSRSALMDMLEETEKARRTAEQERNRTAAIITNFTDGLLLFNEEGVLEVVNPRAEKLLGVAGSDIFGKRPEELKILPSFKRIVGLVEQRRKQEGAGMEEVEIGNRRVLEVARIPIRTGGELRGNIVSLHDITREKEMERLKIEFVSLAAHQLRTPLSAIKWALHMLLDGSMGKMTQEQRNFLGKTYQSNERMINLVNGLLDVTRIEEGRYVYKPVSSQMEELAEGVVRLYTEEAKRRSVKLEWHKPKCKLPTVLIDVEKVRLAVQNLIDNALRYNKKGGRVMVAVSYLQKSKEVQVTVANEGIGIPSDQHERVFTKFFRANNAKLVDTEGSGLGLYLVKNIIAAHKGKISFQSKEGKGATFFFVLPVEKVPLQSSLVGKRKVR